MAAKLKVISDVEALRLQVSELEDRCGVLRARADEKDGDLRSARARINELSHDLEKVLRHNGELQREVGRLEGYKQRVSEQDMLEHKLTPMHRSEAGGGVVSSRYPLPDIGNGCAPDERFWNNRR